ncbi:MULTISPECIES: SAM-dependent methyltransferase [unclassified Nocardia]|uniref:SAM-dependent methyltransferase n=1 Tax=unclassified Nocardia TaxID=2637762 RepID=UPI001CE4ACFC|nr:MULTISPECIES: SAM-dependent methyltransferase [unclassified Nocardia]
MMADSTPSARAPLIEQRTATPPHTLLSCGTAPDNEQSPLKPGEVSDRPRVLTGLDPTKPNSARLHNYILGGKDNYEVDQIAAHRMLAVAPDTRTAVFFSRHFLLSAVRMAAEAGIRQFVDIGAGMPFSPNVHEVAHKFQPSALVASIDYDPVVHVHAHALLSAPGVTPLLADVRCPGDLIDRCRTEAGVDWAEPVAVLLVGVLDYVMDDEHPAAILARLREAMAPSSYLAFTHASTDTDPDLRAISDIDTAGSSAQVRFRHPYEIARLLDGFEHVGPGVVSVQEWLDDDLPVTRLDILAGIGRVAQSWQATKEKATTEKGRLA